MKIDFESTVRELAESQIRAYRQSATYKRNRCIVSFLYWVITGLFSFFLVRSLGDERSALTISLLFAGFTFVVIFFFYPAIASGRITKDLERERKSRGFLSLNTTYTIHPDQITCRCTDVEISFLISDLSDVIEDEYFLELTFGEKGFFTIPVRAFESEIEKEAFKARVRGEPSAQSERGDASD